MEVVVVGALLLAVLTILILIVWEKHMQELKVTFTINIAPPPPPPLQVVLPDGSTAQSSPAPNALPDGQVGVSFDQQLSLKGGTPPDTLALSSGALPDGLELDSTGHITGTPTTAGSFTFELDVKDSGQ